MSKKQINITPSIAAQFIRDVQECLAEANAMETSEFFMDGIEGAMERAGIPKIKGYENPKFGAPGDDHVIFRPAPAVVVAEPAFPQKKKKSHKR